MKRLDSKELAKRAKKLYFDANPNIEEVYVNEFGQFSYNNGALEEINKHREVDVYKITRNSVKNLKTDIKEENKEEVFKKLQNYAKGLKTKASKAEEAAEKETNPDKKKDLENKTLDYLEKAEEAQNKADEAKINV